MRPSRSEHVGPPTPDLGPDYRVTLVPGGPTPEHVLVTVDHRPTRRRKTGSAPGSGVGRMAACLRQDIEEDLLDVSLGNIPADHGVFAPLAEESADPELWVVPAQGGRGVR